LPIAYYEFLPLFSKKESNKLPLFREKGIDYSIELKLDEYGKEKIIPWGLLYSISKDELLIFRKILTKLLDKQFV
jgi:hypothetical protein